MALPTAQLAKSAWLEALASTEPARPLPGSFYCDPEIFELERRELFPSSWFSPAPSRRLQNAGDVGRHDFAGESVILARQHDGALRCFANVCRHRGATLCRKGATRATQFVCPYHAWVYGLDGRLEKTRERAVAFDPELFSLVQLGCFERWGQSFVTLAERAELPSHAIERLDAVLGFHELERTHVVAEQSYECHVNWKLFVENFLECYHCAINHPQFRSVAAFIDQLERGDLDALVAEDHAFSVRTRDSTRPLLPPQTIDSNADDFAMVRTFALGGAVVSGTEDGRPVAIPLGRHRSFDGGHSYGALGPFFHFFIYSDYAVLFRFLPLAAERLSIELTWCVHEDAPKVDPQRLTWLWHHTICQDIRITENTQARLGSRFYTPSPYASKEADCAAFTTWYRRVLHRALERG
jgi:Rieske 2Fe-2S family protein